MGEDTQLRYDLLCRIIEWTRIWAKDAEQQQPIEPPLELYEFLNQFVSGLRSLCPDDLPAEIWSKFDRIDALMITVKDWERKHRTEMPYSSQELNEVRELARQIVSKMEWHTTPSRTEWAVARGIYEF